MIKIKFEEHIHKKKPCQPNHDFSKTQFEKTWRRFNPAWFIEYANWLKYNILEDAAYCLYCYIFRPNTGKQKGGDSFVTQWLKKVTKEIVSYIYIF
jgi:hypothetical protein